MTARFSLAQQQEAVSFALTRQRSLARGGSVRGLRGKSTEEFDCLRLEAAERTLTWLMTQEREIRAFLALPPEIRKEVLAQVPAPKPVP
jgi:hypothetical protein